VTVMLLVCRYDSKTVRAVDGYLVSVGSDEGVIVGTVDIDGDSVGRVVGN